ncbi:MAG: DUF2905 domain-containing protein [Nitrospira sp.]|jgi:hypothetical protein|nr:DUF2905 domain-containing protein [Nitrospira sp.]
MEDWSSLGKLLIAAGAGVVLVGLILVLGERLSGVGSWFGWIGRLPGDISIKRDHFSFYFPLGTSLVLSVVLSLVFYLVSWLFRR